MAVHPKYERNMGFINEYEQSAIGAATVAIAGAGGDGGALAEALVRMGFGEVGGEIRIADPEVFEEENRQRQAMSNEQTEGKNKAESVADGLRLIRPELKVVTYSDGVQPHNVEEFLDGANLLLDESEFTLHGIGVMLAREARKRSIPNMHALNVGFGAQLTSYDAAGRFTLEKRLGLPKDAPIDEISEMPVDINRWLAGWPKYMHQSVIDAVLSGQRKAPSIAPGVLLAAAHGATQALLHIIGGQNRRPDPVWAPRTIVTDTMTLDTLVVDNTLERTLETADVVRTRSAAGANPVAGY